MAAGLGGVACAITVLSLSMREVLDLGGSCATGGPHVVARPCPTGIPGLMVGAVFGGLVAALVYAVSLVPRGPRFVGLLWPALFLTLGWNFLDAGWSPPGGEGRAWAWLACGVVFVLMGGVPLALQLTVRPLRCMLWGDDGPAGWRSVVPTAPFRPESGPPGPVLQWLGSLPADRPRADPSPNGTSPAAPAAPVTGSPDADLVSRLERLADLRRRGALSEPEFEAAKRDVLEGR